MKAPAAVVGVGASAGGLEPLKAFAAGLPADSPLAFLVVQHLPPDHRSRLADLLSANCPLEVLDCASGDKLAAGRVYVAPPGRVLTVEGLTMRVRDRDPSVPAAVRAPVDRLLESLAREWGDRSAAVILSGRGSDGTQGVRSVREAGGFAVVQAPETATEEDMPRNALATGLVDRDLPPSDIGVYLREVFDRRAALLGLDGIGGLVDLPPGTDGSQGRPDADGSEGPTVEAPVADGLDKVAVSGATPFLGDVGAGELPIGEVRDGLESVLELVRNRSDHDFTHYKTSTLLRRVRRRMSLRGLTSLEEYRLLLADRPEELRDLVGDVPICVTSFFRNPDAWAFLSEKVFPRLAKQARKENRPVRIWSAGCATGEEPYSLAMLAAEAADRTGVASQVFATDVSEAALSAARDGVYPQAVEATVDPARLGRFFIQQGDSYRVSKLLRQRVVFARHDLTGDPPFSNLDLIVCRNLLIYLEADAQDVIMRQLRFALRPGGHLFLGASESVARGEGHFEVPSKKHRVFRRPRTAGAGAGPSSGPSSADPIGGASGAADGEGFGRPLLSRTRLKKRRVRAVTRRNALEEEFRRLALSTGGRASVLVRPNFRILYSAGPVQKYLEVPDGAPTDSLLDQARSGLRAKLRGAIHAATRDGVEVVHGVREIRTDGARPGGESQDSTSAGHEGRGGDAGEHVMVRIRVVPVEAEGHDERLLMVHLMDEPLAADLGDAPPDGSAGAARVRALEEELDVVRRELSDTIEQLETANEDLEGAHEEALSMNEELQSGNEELEAGREELQSLNEELTTLNSQLEAKVDELEGLNDDLQNLLTSTRIAVVFLDSGLRVRRFTDEAGELFRLIRTDVGRPIDDLAHRFIEDRGVIGDRGVVGDRGDDDARSGESHGSMPEGAPVRRTAGLIKAARTVLTTLEPDRREVRSEDGRWFLRRILPYRTQDNRIEGVAVTFVDVTELKRTQDELAKQETLARTRADEIETIYQHAPIGLAAMTPDLRHARINEALAEINGRPVADHLGRTPREILPELADAVMPLMSHVMRTGEADQGPDHPRPDPRPAGRGAACGRPPTTRCPAPAIGRAG